MTLRGIGPHFSLYSVPKLYGFQACETVAYHGYGVSPSSWAVVATASTDGSALTGNVGYVMGPVVTLVLHRVSDPVTVSIGDTLTPEGDSRDRRTIRLPLTLSGPSTQEVSIS